MKNIINNPPQEQYDLLSQTVNKLIKFRLVKHRICNLLVNLIMTIAVLISSCCPAFAEKMNLPLYKISPLAKAVDLHCLEAEYSIQIPMPKRWSVKNAVLRFDYINSVALLKQNSQLVISLNNTPLSQIKLDPLTPNGYAEVDLPGALLKPGYNMLSFKVAQHYSLNCEAPCAPELWTRLKLDEALISFEYEQETVPLKLSALSDLVFDPRTIPDAHLHLITEKLTENTLTTAGIVASGAALRFDYRKTTFTLSDQIVGGQDNVLLGEKDYVEGFLKNLGVNMTVASPVLKLVHLPGKLESGGITVDPHHVLLVVSGRNADEIKLAAETMSIMSIPFPDADEMQVSEFVLPEISLYEGKQMLVADEKYPFVKLDYQNHSFSGLSPNAKDISFRLPPDFLIKPNQQATLSLDFSFGAGMKSDSALNITLNGQFISAAHLDNPNGGLITDYRIGLPTFLFKAGTNVLSFQPQMTPLHGEHCHYLQTGNLQLTLFDTSSLEFPQMPHRIELPRLDLLAINGFPYTRWPDGFETLIVLSEAKFASANAALNLIGMITQKNGYPLFGIRVNTDLEEKWDKEIILIGTQRSIPQEYYEKAPLKLGETNKVPYPVYQNWDIHPAMSWSQQTSMESSDKGIIMQLASPFKEGRTATLFTAANDEGIDRLGRALLEPEVQGALKGDLVFIDFVVDKFKQIKFGDGTDFKITALKTGNSFVTGKGGDISQVNYYLSSYPWLYWVLLFSILLIVAVITYTILKRRRKRRLVPNDPG